MFTGDHLLTGALMAPLAAPVIAPRMPMRMRNMAIMMAAACAAPDLDFLVKFFGDAFYYAQPAWTSSLAGRILIASGLVAHRGWTHSLLGAIVVGYVLAALARSLTARAARRSGGAPWSTTDFRAAWMLSTSCAVIHLVQDLWTPVNPYWDGIPLLWPLPIGFGDYDRVAWWDHAQTFYLMLGGTAAYLSARIRAHAGVILPRTIAVAAILFMIWRVATSDWRGELEFAEAMGLWMEGEKAILPAFVYETFMFLHVNGGALLFKVIPALFGAGR